MSKNHLGSLVETRSLAPPRPLNEKMCRKGPSSDFSCSCSTFPFPSSTSYVFAFGKKTQQRVGATGKDLLCSDVYDCVSTPKSSQPSCKIGFFSWNQAGRPCLCSNFTGSELCGNTSESTQFPIQINISVRDWNKNESGSQICSLFFPLGILCITTALLIAHFPDSSCIQSNLGTLGAQELESSFYCSSGQQCLCHPL